MRHLMNRWTVVGAALGVALVAFAGLASATDPAAGLPPSDAAEALLRTGSGRLVALCEAGDLIEHVGPGMIAEEDTFALAATAREAADAYLADMRIASSAANPMLADLPAGERQAYVEYFATYQWPIQHLDLPSSLVEGDTHVFEKPVDLALATAHEADAGKWVSARLEVEEVPGRGYHVTGAYLCSSALFVDGALEASPAGGGGVKGGLG